MYALTYPFAATYVLFRSKVYGVRVALLARSWRTSPAHELTACQCRSSSRMTPWSVMSAEPSRSCACVLMEEPLGGDAGAGSGAAGLGFTDTSPAAVARTRTAGPSARSDRGPHPPDQPDLRAPERPHPG
jgi:hypothetical protein